MKILIVVPAYNESENIVGVIDSLRAVNPEWDIVVINDCSTDNTASLVDSTNKATVISLPCNLGIGGAVQTGFKYAKAKNYDIVVKFDGDGQHISTEINKILTPILSNESDVVIGSRFLEVHDGFKSTFLRLIGIKIFSIVNSFLIHQKITDNTSGFRAYNRRAIDFLHIHYPSFDYPEPEEVILLGKNGFRLKEIFTEMQQRLGGRSSITGLKSIYYMIKVLLAVCIVAIRGKTPHYQRHDS